jgi:hypothetical protein
MPIQFDKFDQQKIDRLKSHLESMATKGTPKFYEIFVDGLKAVPKTDEPKEFEGYEDYMTPETGQIKVVVYCSGASPRNDQYVYSMKAKSNEEALDFGLNGIAIKSFTTNELKELRLQRDQKAAYKDEIKELNEEIDGLYKELDEKKSYIDRLEKAVEVAKANGNKIGGVHVGEMLSVAAESFLKRNAHNIEKSLGVEGLSGFFTEGNESKTENKTLPETEVTLKKKNSSEINTELSEQDKSFLALFREIQKHFSQSEFDQIIEVVEKMSKDKSKIKIILELLSDEAQEKKGNDKQ